MSHLLELFGSAAFVAAAIRLSVPIMAAGVGEVVSEKAGMINIGLEGMMLMGAFTSVVGSLLSGNAWVGVVAGMAGGVSLAVVQGVVAIRLAGDQIVAGLALNLVAQGLTTFFSRRLFGITHQPQVQHFSPLHVPGLSELPLLGPALFSQNLFFYGVVVIALALWLLLFRSRLGLAWRAAGEDPEALDSMGRSVSRARWSALLLCGAMAGLGGTVIALGELFTFIDNMTGGRGFIALALVIVARWSPLWAAAVAILFGAAEAVSLRVQGLAITILPYQLSLMMPYALTLVVYALAARWGRPPRALGRGFFKA